MPKARVVPVSLARPPAEFRKLDLRLRVPAIHIVSAEGNEELDPLDSADDIVSLLESRYPGGIGSGGPQIEAEADQASRFVHDKLPQILLPATTLHELITPGPSFYFEHMTYHEHDFYILFCRDFFSRFCFLIRGVAKDSANLESSLRTFDEYLKSPRRVAGEFLCGGQPGLLDCEILPKLHQVRVAAQAIKGEALMECRQVFNLMNLIVNLKDHTPKIGVDN